MSRERRSPSRSAVDSDSIASIGRCDRTGEVGIRFRSGSDVFVYENVPACVFQEVVDSQSIGKSFNKNLRGKCPSRKK